MNFKKGLANVLVTGLGILLLGYSAFRSIDFVSLTVPADKQFLAYLAVAATELGIVFWLATFLWGSSGAIQRAIAAIMTIVDFAGSTALFVADTMLRSGENGLIAEMAAEDVQLVIVGLSVVVAANILATIAYHATDPEVMRNMAAEEAKDEIDQLTLKKIQENSKLLAAEVAPQIASDWMMQTRARYMHQIVGAKGGRRALPATTEASEGEDEALAINGKGRQVDLPLMARRAEDEAEWVAINGMGGNVKEGQRAPALAGKASNNGNGQGASQGAGVNPTMRRTPPQM